MLTPTCLSLTQALLLLLLLLLLLACVAGTLSASTSVCTLMRALLGTHKEQMTGLRQAASAWYSAWHISMTWMRQQAVQQPSTTRCLRG
jgi:hypothetical protein